MKKMTRQNAKQKHSRNNVTKNILLKAIKENPNITIEEISELIGYSLIDAKNAMCRYRRNGVISYEAGFKNFVALKETEEEKERQLKAVSKELYQWKQSEYLKMYLDGRELVNSTSLRATDRVKQNELNYKVLKAIDDPSILVLLQEIQGEE